MGKISDRLRSARSRLRRLKRNMASSNSKADVFDMDMAKDQILDELRNARRGRF